MNSHFNNKPPSFTPGLFYLFRILKASPVKSKFSIALKIILSSLFLVCFSPAHAALTDGLVAYWSFDDCTAKDNSGNGHDGVIQNNAQCTEGKNGKVLSFNGSSQFVEVQDPNSDFATTNLSISVWINPSDSQMDYAAIIDKSHTSASDAISGWVLQKSPIGDGLPFYFAYCTNTPYCSSWDTGDGSQRVTVNTNNWSHLVITKQGGDVAYYLNNQFVSKQTYSFSEYTKTSLPLLIGAVNQQGGANARYFNGLIDELRVYNRALTDTEVKTLYNQGSAPAITSITPIVAVLDQETTFTVTGTNLTDGMGFTIGDCDASNVEVGTGNSSQRQFKCTPRGTAGQKTGFIKTKPGGERLYNFDVKIQPTASLPIIVDVNPKTALLNTETEFTVTGGNLTHDMGFTIADCDASNTEVIGKATAISRTFKCTPRGSVGRKVGIVKTAPGELAVHYFDVVVKASKTAAADKASAKMLGEITNNPGLKNVDLKVLLDVTDTTVTLSKSMQTKVVSWPMDTVFKIGSLIRKLKTAQVNTDGTVLITTLIATQEDWLNSINISGTVPLTSSNLIPDADVDTAASLRVEAFSAAELGQGSRLAKAIRITNDKDTFKFIFEDHVLYDADENPATKLDQLLINGSLLMEKPKVTLAYTKSYLPLAARVDVTFKASETFDLTYSSQEISFRANKSLSLGTFVLPIPVSGGTAYGRLALFLVFDANGKAQITVKFYQTAKVDLGYTAETANGLFSFSKLNKSIADLQKPTASVTGELNASLMLNAALNLLVFNYDLTGINAGAGPSLKLTGKVKTDSSCVTSSFNIGANASAYMMLPEVKVTENDWGWYNFEATMVKRTEQVFSGTLSKKPYAFNGCTL